MSNRQNLSDYLREQANWRSGIADEYDDDRNTRSGMSLLDYLADAAESDWAEANEDESDDE